ncbi:MAG: 2-phosphosulfolactate phosphatase [Cytophagales bacterium]|jgi:2-phosphosulfolactate phosphatase|nr:2-phosphosulfolactate phosphatase [Cytophagales bacterium]MCA6367035.1 2-phosphosulfolactate phosphatase [Cytophagales bacterium]MCA6374106.1 2-phosphosulfolactate phosphatase [Cytophagales bacterium]MCA6375480.1 2-phosphosulfolactate phosphatase [Cytophagales bacterium]MCA6382125.1 2-phosphosulfolactate phosphatase [Cytophagales bacterium]
MKTIDVCLSPELMHLYPVQDKTVVVVDILRATSCMVTAFAHGVESITPIANLEECQNLKLRGYVISGERDGKKVEGFDKGNSPFEYMGEQVRGLKIAFTTTNGTQAIEKSKGAKDVIIGSFLNLNAVAKYLLLNEHNVLVVCAGWKGKVNLEDTLFAGALVDKLKDYLGPDCDAPLAAQHLYNIAKDDMVSFLNASSHVRRLNKLNIHDDLKFCVTPDQYTVLPRLINGVLQLR